MGSLRVTEIFHSIQGEGTRAGTPCAFVRLTGCPMRCAWCDTAYAFEGGESLAIPAILERIVAFDCPLVEVTGGEPLAQKDTRELLSRLADAGYTVLVETGGGVSIEDIDPRSILIYDVKCPDSGELEHNLWENLPLLKPHVDEVKFVLASRRDYEWALRFVTERGVAERHTVLFAPAWGLQDPTELAGWMLADRAPARLQLPIHKILWGADARGV